MVLLIRDAEVAQVLRMEDVIRVSTEAYLAVDGGLAANRPRTFTYCETPAGRFNANTMEGILVEKGVYSTRLAVRNNPRAGQEASGRDSVGTSVHLLYDLHTGDLLALIQDGPIGQMRVQAINAIAARYMARADAHSMALIGSGYQANASIDAMRAVLPIERVTVYSKTREHREEFVARMQRIHEDIEVRLADSVQEAVRGAELVVAATNSYEPVFKGEWVEPGMHLTGVLAHEFDLATYERADRILIYNRMHARDYTLTRGPEEAEIRPTPHAHLLADAPEMTDLVSGRVKGRLSNDQVTLFANGGHGRGLDGGPGYPVQLTAVAKLAYDLACERGLGQQIPFEFSSEFRGA
ncbi:MAG: hypothetical protein HW416_825 [Chloroflexi bacterium]|nr:hypothetical protein [Chloroflexota bacterium]